MLFWYARLTHRRKDFQSGLESVCQLTVTDMILLTDMIPRTSVRLPIACMDIIRIIRTHVRPMAITGRVGFRAASLSAPVLGFAADTTAEVTMDVPATMADADTTAGVAITEARRSVATRGVARLAAVSIALEEVPFAAETASMEAAVAASTAVPVVASTAVVEEASTGEVMEADGGSFHL